MSRLELRFGAPVVVDGRKWGTLAGVILDKAGQRWDGLIVRRGLFRRTYWSVPRSEVREASDPVIVVTEPPAAPAHLDTSRTVTAATKVRTEQGRRLGRLALLLTGADGRLCHAVMERRRFSGRRMAPVETIATFEPGELVLGLDEHAVDGMLPYYRDNDLAVFARWALERVAGVGHYEGAHINVRAEDGVIVLTGTAVSGARARQIEAAVATVPGVLGVINQLVADDEPAGRFPRQRWTDRGWQAAETNGGFAAAPFRGR